MNSTVARFHNCVHAYKIKLSYNQTDVTNHIHNTPTVPISTSGMLSHILTDCSRGTGEGQGEEEEKEEDTEEG